MLMLCILKYEYALKIAVLNLRFGTLCLVEQCLCGAYACFEKHMMNNEIWAVEPYSLMRVSLAHCGQNKMVAILKNDIFKCIFSNEKGLSLFHILHSIID